MSRKLWVLVAALIIILLKQRRPLAILVVVLIIILLRRRRPSDIPTPEEPAEPVEDPISIHDIPNITI